MRWCSWPRVATPAEPPRPADGPTRAASSRRSPTSSERPRAATGTIAEPRLRCQRDAEPIAERAVEAGRGNRFTGVLVDHEAAGLRVHDAEARDDEVALIAGADESAGRRVDVGHRRTLGRDHVSVGRVRLEEVRAAVEFAGGLPGGVDEGRDVEGPLVAERDLERTRVGPADRIHERLVEHDRASSRRRGRRVRGGGEQARGEGHREASGSPHPRNRSRRLADHRGGHRSFHGLLLKWWSLAWSISYSA